MAGNWRRVCLTSAGVHAVCDEAQKGSEAMVDISTVMQIILALLMLLALVASMITLSK
jgi:hypothetical protein